MFVHGNNYQIKKFGTLSRSVFEINPKWALQFKRSVWISSQYEIKIISKESKLWGYSVWYEAMSHNYVSLQRNSQVTETNVEEIERVIAVLNRSTLRVKLTVSADDLNGYRQTDGRY